MTHYLWENSREDGEAFIYGGWPNHVAISFHSGERILAPVPALEITMNSKSQGRLTDNLLLAGRGFVFSQRLIDLLRANGVDNFDAYPCTVRNIVTSEEHRHYSVVNVVGKIACVDRDRSEAEWSAADPSKMIGYEFLFLDESKIDGARFFLLAELTVQIVVDETIALAIRAAGTTGVELRQQGPFTQPLPRLE